MLWREVDQVLDVLTRISDSKVWPRPNWTTDAISLCAPLLASSCILWWDRLCLSVELLDRNLLLLQVLKAP